MSKLAVSKRPIALLAVLAGTVLPISTMAKEVFAVHPASSSSQASSKGDAGTNSADTQSNRASEEDEGDFAPVLDYQLQGEYVGEIPALGGVWGAQIIALGKNELEMLLIEHGLPGLADKANKPKYRTKLSIDSQNKSASGTVEGLAITVSDNQIVLRSDKNSGKTAAQEKTSEDNASEANKEKDGVLAKVKRQSPTINATPPADAKVLLSDDINEFEGAKLVGKYLGVGGKSKLKLGDHKLHLEFRTPFQPDDRGQGRGNSGVYIQGRYELQVLDSFGLDGKDNECGGIYSISAPKLNMCLPPGSWQTYDIDFKAARFEDGKKISNARVTIRHNGVVIHDDLELKHGTPGYLPEGPEPAELYLQDHGNPVVYRNIWVVETGK